LALIFAYVLPHDGAGAQIVISHDETIELGVAITNISERITALRNNIHALNSGGARP